MILKSVIKYANADAIEATWVRRDQLPDVDVPGSPALYDEAGNEVVPAVAAHTVPGEFVETVLRCHAYSHHPEQMYQLRADLGSDAAQYEALIAEVEATYIQPAPPTQEEIAAQAKAAVQEQINALERQYLMPRITREFVLAAAEKEAASLGIDPMVNKGYAALKVFDSQIAALRALL